MKKVNFVSFLLIGILFLSSCEKVLDVDIPDGAVGIVFEGYIENGSFPYVIITRSANYFDPISTSTQAILESLVEADTVTIEVDGMVYPMNRTCLSDLPPELQEEAMEFLGFGEIPTGVDICIYMNFTLEGELGKSYTLRAIVPDEAGALKTYTATTHIYQPIDLDSLWYKLDEPNDSLGFIWTKLTDPDTLGNYYYMWTERLGRDNGFAAVDQGSFGDRFFNGETFDFAFARGHHGLGDFDEDEEYFRLGDTVVVKLGMMDVGVYDFWETAGAAISGGGNPFSSPVTVVSNFDNGGKGVWAGYAVSYDTIICVDVP